MASPQNAKDKFGLPSHLGINICAPNIIIAPNAMPIFGSKSKTKPNIDDPRCTQPKHESQRRDY